MKKKNTKIVIKASDIRVSIGHQQHQSGGGAHNNKPRKMRTRSQRNRHAIKEYSY